MKTLTVSAIALAFSLCGPVAAYANHSTSQVHKARVYQRVAHATIPTNASAFAPAAAFRTPETDGLSRDRDDCNYGCIDNGD